MAQRLSTILLFLSFLQSPALANSTLPVDPKKSHLEFSLEGGLPNLKIFKNRDWKGRPVMLLNEEGLVVSSQVVCRWPNRKFEASKAHNMVLASEIKATGEAKLCEQGRPIISTWGDGGVGTAVLYLEIEKLIGDVATINYKGKSHFLSLKTLRGKYQLRKPGEISNQPGD